MTLPVFGLSLAQEGELTGLWEAVGRRRKRREGKDDLSLRVLSILLERAWRSRLHSEDEARIPEHEPLAALAALRRLLGTAREARSACEEVDFASTFATLTSACCSYFGDGKDVDCDQASL